MKRQLFLNANAKMGAPGAIKSAEQIMREQNASKSARISMLLQVLKHAEQALAMACSNEVWEDMCPCGGNLTLDEANDNAMRNCPILRARIAIRNAAEGGKE